MALFRVEEAVGTIDGANQTFFTLSSYLPNTVRLWLNGLLYPKDCLVEVDSVTGEVQLLLDVPPRDGDQVQLGWIDLASIQAELGSVVQALVGKIEPEASLDGFLREEDALLGQLDAEVALNGSVVTEGVLLGTLEPEIVLRGSIRVCEG